MEQLEYAIQYWHPIGCHLHRLVKKFTVAVLFSNVDSLIARQKRHFLRMSAPSISQPFDVTAMPPSNSRRGDYSISPAIVCNKCRDANSTKYEYRYTLTFDMT
uniref:Uncharacterized protein n=1 Tax=Strigamia maritima TaxID=126957 RepID=T1IVT8_STRMM